MTRYERVTRRVARLHAIEDAVLTMMYYAATWSILMTVVKAVM